MKIKSIQSILNDLGHQQEFIDLVRNTIINSSNDKGIMTYEYFQQYCLTYEQMPEDMPLSLVGKVTF